MTKLAVTLTTLIKSVVYLNLALSAVNMAYALFAHSGTSLIAALLGLGAACFLAWIAKDI